MLESSVFYYLRSFINCHRNLEVNLLFSESLSHCWGCISVSMSKIVLYGHSVDFVYLQMDVCMHILQQVVLLGFQMTQEIGKMGI